jgi:hypothetical protein
VTVPAYYRSQTGRVYRVQRARADLGDGRQRYLLRALPVLEEDTLDADSMPVEEVRELSEEDLRERIRLRHQILTPEHTFEQLWQRLRVHLDAAA